ncbi:MAG: galactokinase [Verrucomicrobia bacterium]|nr:galactokinase [Verrucomicrobiota bacterium]
MKRDGSPLFHPPSLDERANALKSALVRSFHVSPSDVRIVVSPYRVCPLGAHVDHQLGVVTGLALNQAVLLAFAPSPEAHRKEVAALSKNYPGKVSFELDSIPPFRPGDWGNYLRGAALALRDRFGKHLVHGMVAMIDGDLPIGGLSSSAAVGVAYLLGLEAVNGLSVSIADNIHFDRAIENGYIGLRNGILDQSVILAAERDRLLSLDCQSETWHTVRGPKAGSFQILVVYSGFEQALVSTGYNQRVAECREAAKQLLNAAGHRVANGVVLRQVSEEMFVKHGISLPATLRKRATHFFTEQARVRDGAAAWAGADAKQFGALVSQSGKSSVENYECGSPPLITLYELLINSPGVLGARFSGAGFRGNCIALVEPGCAESVAIRVAEGYARRHPAEARTFSACVCETDDGARLL